MTRCLAFTLAFLLLIATSAFAFIGNQRTHKFHRDSCTWVLKMSPQNKIYFELREKAVQAGYIPCKVCRP
jgi:methylphosphotriester-DNA--protein-cysteine methyltransferase